MVFSPARRPRVAGSKSHPHVRVSPVDLHVGKVTRSPSASQRSVTHFVITFRDVPRSSNFFEEQRSHGNLVAPLPSHPGMCCVGPGAQG